MLGGACSAQTYVHLLYQHPPLPLVPFCLSYPLHPLQISPCTSLTDVHLYPPPTGHRISHSWYPHTSTRPFHIALLASLYAQSYNEVLTDYAASSYSSPLRTPHSPNRNPLNDVNLKRGLHTHVIPVINFVSSSAINGQLSITLETIDNVYCGERDEAMQVDFQRYSGHMRRRYREMLEEQRRATTNALKTALIEGVFPHGDDTVVTLTVKLEERRGAGGGTKWEGVYSIVRFG